MLRLVFVIALVVLAAGSSLAALEQGSEVEKIANAADAAVDPSEVVRKKQTVEELADDELDQLGRDHEYMDKIYNAANLAHRDIEYLEIDRTKIHDLLSSAFEQRANVIEGAVMSARTLKSEDEFIKAVYEAHLEGNKRADVHLNEINGIIDTISPLVLHKCRHEIMKKRVEAYRAKLAASTSSLNDDTSEGTVSANHVMLPEIKRLADEEIDKLGQDYEKMANIFGAASYAHGYSFSESARNNRDLVLSQLIDTFKERAKIIELALDEAIKMKSLDEFYKTMYGAHLEAYAKSQATFDEIFQIEDHVIPYYWATECRDEIMTERINAYRAKLDSSSVAEIDEAKKEFVPSEYSLVKKMVNEEKSALRYDFWKLSGDNARPSYLNPDGTPKNPLATMITVGLVGNDFDFARKARENVIKDALVEYYPTIRQFYQAMVSAHQHGNRLAEEKYNKFYTTYGGNTSKLIDLHKVHIRNRLVKYQSKLKSLPYPRPAVIPASHVSREKPAKGNVLGNFTKLFKQNKGAPSKKKSARM